MGLNACAVVGPGHILAERHFVILLSTAVFTLPLSLYRNIEKLGKVCLICCMYISALLAPCKPSVRAFRCPCCRWC